MNKTIIKNDETTDCGLVVCQFIGRFVFVAHMKIVGRMCVLKDVRNIRYWDSRDNGLGDLATHGPINGDKIDTWPDTTVPIDKLGPFMPASEKHWGSKN